MASVFSVASCFGFGLEPDLEIGDWGLEIGDWRVEIGDWSASG